MVCSVSNVWHRKIALTGIAEHAANFFFIVVELFLNKLTFVWSHSLALPVWALAYLTLQWVRRVNAAC